MSIESAWIGESTETSSCVCVCVSVTGTVTLSGSGFTAPASQSVNTGTNSGVARFDVTGLTKGQSYPATVTFTGGNSIAVTMKTLSDDKLHIAIISCTDSNKSRKHAWNSMRDTMNALDAPVILMSVGDFGYADNTPESYGALSSTPSNNYDANSEASDFQGSYRLTKRIMLQLPWVQDIIRHNPVYFILDDHDIFDGWDWSLLEANRAFQDNGAPSVEQIPDVLSDANKILYLQDMYDLSREVYDDFSQGNPTNTDSDLDTYPVASYFRQRVGTLCELFAIDAVSYRHPRTSGGVYTEPWTIITDVSGNKTLLGDTGKALPVANAGSGDGKQLPWFKAQLTASEAAGVKHKIVACNKKTHPNNPDNTDHMGNWSNERDSTLKWIVDNSITSVVWGTGDRHDPVAIYRHGDETIDSATVNVEHVCVSACPIGRYQVGVTPVAGATYEPHVVWKGAGQSGDYTPWNKNFRCYSIATITPEKQEWSIYSAQEVGRYVWRGHVNAGENKLSYVRPKL